MEIVPEQPTGAGSAPPAASAMEVVSTVPEAHTTTALMPPAAIAADPAGKPAVDPTAPTDGAADAPVPAEVAPINRYVMSLCIAELQVVLSPSLRSAYTAPPLTIHHLCHDRPAPAPAKPNKELKVEDALHYLDQVSPRIPVAPRD